MSLLGAALMRGSRAWLPAALMGLLLGMLGAAAPMSPAPPFAHAEQHVYDSPASSTTATAYTRTAARGVEQASADGPWSSTSLNRGNRAAKGRPIGFAPGLGRSALENESRLQHARAI